MNPHWLDRTLTECAYHYTLVLTEEDFFAELKRIELPEYRWDIFLGNGSPAKTYHFQHDGNNLAVVALDAELAKTKEPIQVAALLVHEAVHIWQRHADAIGSHNDHGDEEEAYAIQSIAQCLMYEYARQTK